MLEAITCYFPLPLLLFHFHVFDRRWYKMSCWDIAVPYFSPWPCSRQGVNHRAEEEDNGHRVMAESCSVLPWDEADELNLAEGFISSFLACLFIPIGLGRKSDVSNQVFISEKILCILKLPSLVLPFSLLLTHHISSAYTYLHIWSLWESRKGGLLWSCLAQCCKAKLTYRIQ